MSYHKDILLKNQGCYDITTSGRPEVQLWQELVTLRHLAKPKGVFAKTLIAPWIDQAKIYFLDACNSDWRTGGLLYYYSFLNVAKAYLAAKRKVSANELKSTSAYHGLTADPQSPTKITDFEIRIHPPKGSKTNLFSALCEQLTGAKWPHRSIVDVRASDFLPYCISISKELHDFHRIGMRIVVVQSLLREARDQVWYELNVRNSDIAVIESQVPEGSVTVANFQAMNREDFHDWFNAFDRSQASLHGTSFVRTGPQSLNANNRSEVFGSVIREAERLYSKYMVPLPYFWRPERHEWQFVQVMSLGGQLMRWHPLLSDYLFAFVLSTILRYHPHLLTDGGRDSFIAEAWCNQSSLTALRYFLMAFTTPSIRMMCTI